jgi:tetratricopeptide (TPR) repeat protein
MSVRSLLLLLSLGGCASLGPSVQPSPGAIKAPERSAQEIANQAADAFDAGRLAEAQAAYAELTLRAPNLVAVQFDLGLIAERQGRLTEAIERYEAARALDPRHKPTLLNLGRVSSAAGHPEAAVALYEAALKLAGNENDLELTNNLAVAYRLTKRLDDAERAAQRVLARARDNPLAYQTLALVAYDRGSFRLAELLALHAQRLDASAPGPANTLGLIALGRGELRAAHAHFRRALALDARSVPALTNLAALALTYRDSAGAERVLRTLVELEPTSVEGLISLGWALQGQPRKSTEAGRAFEQALALQPDRVEALCGAAWAFSSDRASWEKSFGYFERCRASPRTSEADRLALDTKVKSLRALQLSGPSTNAPSPRGGSDSP